MLSSIRYGSSLICVFIEQGCDILDSTTIDGVFIKKIGNAGFMIKADDMVVYIDPSGIEGNVSEDDMADLLLITHERFGHCDPDSIRKVRKSDCTTLIPEQMGLQFRGDARRVMEDDSLTGELSIKGVDIEVVAAYDSCNGELSSGPGVGYVFVLGGLTFYHAGHTCAVPELGGSSIDVALLPVGGNGTMDAMVAADAVSLMSPQIVVPIGYSQDDGPVVPVDQFETLVNEKSPGTRILSLI